MVASKTAKKTFKTAVFIFRRDLRLDDNTGLLYTLKNAETVYPVFIFDKKQIDPSENKFYGSHCVQFMCESLEDLDRQLQKKGCRLNTLLGSYPDIIESLIASVKPNLVCVNEDYTVYSKDRDKMIEEACVKNGVQFNSFEDICLLTKAQATQGYDGDLFFKKFTPFYNRVVVHKIRLPEECTESNFSKTRIEIEGKMVKDFGKQFYQHSDKLLIKGGRDAALDKLADIHKMKDYEVIRNKPTLKTSLLSAYNKFGCLSIREIFHTARTVLKDKAETFTRQLYWRDFYYFVGFFFPHVFAGPMKPSYGMIPWENDPVKIEAWQKGKTGCPIVDAAMRQMNEVGWMPNRCRMIVSNYLVKDLHVNWQIGERYFANQLVDFDPCQNNGGWQWSAGCGVDSQPYFRIFNPTLQSQKFDASAVYAKTWIAELKKVPAEDIHAWETSWSKFDTDYPKPIVQHASAKQRLIQMYKTSFDRFAADGGAGEYEEAEEMMEEKVPKAKNSKPKMVAGDGSDEEVEKKSRTRAKSNNQTSLDTFVVKKGRKDSSVSPPMLGKRAKTLKDDKKRK